MGCETMKTLMIDMDDVITGAKFFEYICEFLGNDIDINTVETYYLQDLIADQKEEFWEWIKDKNFYDNAPLYSDAYQVIEKLTKKYDIYIVTAYLWNDVIDISGKNLNNKYNYLREKLPFINPDHYIFTTNKNLLQFDIRIDDRLHNVKNAKLGLLFDAWHNKKEEWENENIKRVHNWKEIESILLSEVEQ